MFLRYLINNLILISIFLWYNNHLFKRKKYERSYQISSVYEYSEDTRNLVVR